MVGHGIGFRQGLILAAIGDGFADRTLPLSTVGPVNAIHLVTDQPQRAGVGLRRLLNGCLIGGIHIIERRGIGAKLAVSMVPGATGQLLMDPNHLGIGHIIGSLRCGAHLPIQIPAGAQLLDSRILTK